MKNIILYVLTILVILFVIDSLSYRIFDKAIFNKTYSGVSGGNINYLLKKNKHTDFFIFGNSRAVHHINPLLLKDFHSGNGYNAGINAVGGVVYSDLLLDLIVKNNIAPKAIILHIDPINFRLPDVKSQIGALSMFPNKKIEYEDQFNLADKVFSNFKLTRLNNKALNIIYNYVRPSSETNRNGFISLEGQIKDTVEISTQELAEKSGPFLEVKIRALNNIAKTCNENNIQLIILIQPTFNNVLYHNESQKLIVKQIAEIPNVHLIDYSLIEKIPQLTYSRFWKDKNHFNTEGSTLFSEILNGAIKNLDLK